MCMCMCSRGTHINKTIPINPEKFKTKSILDLKMTFDVNEVGQIPRYLINSVEKLSTTL